MPTSTLPSGVRVSTFVTVTVWPAGPSLTTKTRSGAPTVATSSGIPSTGNDSATVASPIGTTEIVRASRFAVTAYSPERSGSESASGAVDGDAATATGDG
jgi:hypothetical protein